MKVHRMCAISAFVCVWACVCCVHVLAYVGSKPLKVNQGVFLKEGTFKGQPQKYTQYDFIL